MVQFKLFGEEMPRAETSTKIIISKSNNDELTKGQKAFNRYTKKVEDLRRKIENVSVILDQNLTLYGKIIGPLDREVTMRQAEVLDLLFPYLNNGTKLSAKETDVLVDLLSHLLHEVWCFTPEVEERHKQMFEELEGMTPEEADKLEADAKREELEWLFSMHGVNLDLSDVDVTNEEQMARKMKELEDEFGPDPFSHKKRNQKKSKKQLAAETKAEEMEKARNQSLASIYKQLAKALHPDLEQNDALRAEKEELMKQLTSAYEANDLHTILTIETKWVKKNNDNLRALTDEKLEIFNQVLKEQVATLEDELLRLYAHPRYAPLKRFGIYKPYTIKLIMDATVPMIQDRIADIMETADRLKSPNAKKEVKALITGHKRKMKATEWEISFRNDLWGGF